MKVPIEGAKEKFGRCVIEKSAGSTRIDIKEIFILIAEQIVYIMVTLVGTLRSNVSWFLSDPVYMQNLHLYHVFEENDYIEKM